MQFIFAVYCLFRAFLFLRVSTLAEASAALSSFFIIILLLKCMCGDAAWLRFFFLFFVARLTVCGDRRVQARAPLHLRRLSRDVFQ